jgi:hypothetical protein
MLLAFYVASLIVILSYPSKNITSCIIDKSSLTSESESTYPYELSKDELLREGVLSNTFSISLRDFIYCITGVPASDPSV